MYVVNLNHPIQHLSNASMANRQHKVVNIQDFIDIDRIKFLHASLGGPPINTVKQAIKAGYLQSWQGLSVNALNKLQEPDYTILGHMDHVRKNKLSTKEKVKHKDISE